MNQQTLDNIITYALKPLSWVYYGVTEMRNWMFDKNILKSVKFDVPVVSVGNLSVGGTGKTPHVEYIVSRLLASYRIGVVSRGYKRATKGFVLAGTKSTPRTIGDEPYQIYEKYGRRVKVAVCESRVKGIKQLLAADPTINLIILDDAFQHRYVKADIPILIMDYNHPIYEDNILPLGCLREDKSGLMRAEMVVVSKCPDNINSLKCRMMFRDLRMMPYQKLYFSKMRYLPVRPVFAEDHPYKIDLDALTEKDIVVLLTGIANPRPLIQKCVGMKFRTRVLHFPDHHEFTRKDIEYIEKKYNTYKGARKIILTTEKDAGRLLHNPYYPAYLKPYTFTIPMEVEMLNAWADGGDLINDLNAEIVKIAKKKSSEQREEPAS